jgi:hypothetical protein
LKRHGTIVVLTAFLLIVVVAMVAFAIDIGYIATCRTELQRAADAGALAGVGALGDGEESEVHDIIVDYIQQNLVGSQQVPESAIEVELGEWNDETRQFVAGGSMPSAVRVVVELNDKPLFFAPALGTDSFDLSAEAIAMFQPRDIMVVLDYSSSMNDDSELKQSEALGQAAIEANLLQIYQELGSPTFGNLTWNGTYISSTDDNYVKSQLGLSGVSYPFPGGSWGEYIDYVQSSSGELAQHGYRRVFGYKTLVHYWLEKRPLHGETPDLWMTSEQPITALKNSVTVLLAYIQQVEANDRVGLAVYTHPSDGAILETGLTFNMQLVEDISRERQAGHYEHYTNIGAGLREAREEMEENSRTGAFKMIVLITDGVANRPSSNPDGYALAQADLCAEKGYPVVTVSLGVGADQWLMQEIADRTGGVHFNVPGGQSVADYEEQLKDVFRQVAANRPLRLVK